MRQERNHSRAKVTWAFSEILRPVAEEMMCGVNALPVIRDGFARQLERRLSEVLSQCLFLLFTAHRMSGEIFNGSRVGCYAEFVEDVQRRGFETVLKDYPIAQDAIGILEKQAREFAEDFSYHLKEDGKLIAELATSSHESNIATVSAGWSDPHRGGLTVVRVTFADGKSVFYKPRPLGVDQKWAKGLARINERLSLRLRAARVCDRGTHGWAEAIAEKHEAKRQEANEFYYRFGALLCLAWLLDAIDLHRENFVIAGSHPVPVDLECLMHPLVEGESRTLVRTGIIPDPTQEHDLSALGRREICHWYEEVSWRGLGTDDLQMRFSPAQVPAANHLTCNEGTLPTPQETAEWTQSGFQDAASVARTERTFIEEWRAELSQTVRRRIYRPTAFYAAMQRRSAGPRNMSNRTAWHDSLVASHDLSMSPMIAESEADQLSRWDTPVFAVTEGSYPPVEWEELAARQRELLMALSN